MAKTPQLPRTLTFAAFCALFGIGLCLPAGAQSPKSKDQEALKPRLETLTTRDGVKLACGVFPSDKGKKAVPVIIVHQWDGSAPQYLPLANALRDAGCMVCTLDLRGHGQSRNYVDARGQARQFDTSRMNRNDVQAMINTDLEAVKKFLKAENDAERVNLNALTLVGIGEGGILAANYAVLDWNFPDSGKKKQSKDVRALVLVSPEKTLQGFGYDGATRHPLVSRISWQIIAGGNSPQADEAEKIQKQLERSRRSGPTAGPVDLFLPNSPASGPDLVRSSRDVIPRIAAFVKANVVDRQDQFPWVSRVGE